MVLFKDSDFPISGGRRPYARVIRGFSSSRKKVVLAPLQAFTPPPLPVDFFPPISSAPPFDATDSPRSAPQTESFPSFDQERSRLDSDLSDYRSRALQQVDHELATRKAQFQAQLDAEYANRVQAGYEAGLQKAQQELNSQLATHASSFVTLFRDLNAQSTGLAEAAKGDIIAIAVHAAERMISTQLTLSPAIIRDIVDDALRRITDKNKVIIRVNPSDSVWLKDHRDWLDHYSQDIKELIIQDDDRVEQGGCIIETKLGYIDSSIKSKLFSIEKALQAAYEEEEHHLHPKSGSSVISPTITPTPEHEQTLEEEQDHGDALEDDIIEKNHDEKEEETEFLGFDDDDDDEDDFSFDGI